MNIPKGIADNSQADVDEKLERFADCLKKSMDRWYGILLFFSTLVWGLGDLFYDLLHRKPELTGCQIIMALLHLGGT